MRKGWGGDFSSVSDVIPSVAKGSSSVHEIACKFLVDPSTSLGMTLVGVSKVVVS